MALAATTALRGLLGSGGSCGCSLPWAVSTGQLAMKRGNKILNAGRTHYISMKLHEPGPSQGSSRHQRSHGESRHQVLEPCRYFPVGCTTIAPIDDQSANRPTVPTYPSLALIKEVREARFIQKMCLALREWDI